MAPVAESTRVAPNTITSTCSTPQVRATNAPKILSRNSAPRPLLPNCVPRLPQNTTSSLLSHRILPQTPPSLHQIATPCHPHHGPRRSRRTIQPEFHLYPERAHSARDMYKLQMPRNPLTQLRLLALATYLCAMSVLMYTSSSVSIDTNTPIFRAENPLPPFISGCGAPPSHIINTYVFKPPYYHHISANCNLKYCKRFLLRACPVSCLLEPASHPSRCKCIHQCLSALCFCFSIPYPATLRLKSLFPRMWILIHY